MGNNKHVIIFNFAQSFFVNVGCLYMKRIVGSTLKLSEKVIFLLFNT